MTQDEMDRKRARHVIEFEKRHRNVPTFVYKKAL
jgi:phosphopantetheine adenylyltransferase